MASKEQLNVWKTENAPMVQFLENVASVEYNGTRYVDSNTATMAAQRSQQVINGERKDDNIGWLKVTADNADEFPGMSPGYWYALPDLFDIAATPSTRNVSMLTISDGVKVRFNKPAEGKDYASDVARLETAILDAFRAVYGETTQNEQGQHEAPDGTRIWFQLVDRYNERTSS